MVPPKVLVLFRNQLFGEAVRSILEQAREVEVVGVWWCRQASASEVEGLRPDVIVVEWGRGDPPGGWGADMTELLLAGDVPGMRVIFLNLENTRASICESWHLEDIGQDELLGAILGRSGPASDRGDGPAPVEEGGDAREGQNSRSDGRGRRPDCLGGGGNR